MNKKRLVAALLATLLLLTACGCDKAPADPTVSIPDVSEYLPPVEPPVDIDIMTIITAEQIEAIIGTPMTAIGPLESGTWVMYESDNQKKQVSIYMEQLNDAVYDARIAEITGKKEIKDLGEQAYWHPTSGVLCRYKGYYIAVAVTDPSNKNTQKTAEIIVEKIIETIG